MWIKIGLVGGNPMLGTLQGRIEFESFDLDVMEARERGSLLGVLNDAVEHNRTFKLYDPIVLQVVPGQGVGAVALAKGTHPALDENYITISPASIAWFGPIEDGPEWQQIVAGCIHGIELASPSDMPDIDGDVLPGPGSSIIQP